MTEPFQIDSFGSSVWCHVLK